MKKISKFYIPVIIGGLAISLAACSSDNSTDKSPSSSTALTTTSQLNPADIGNQVVILNPVGAPKIKPDTMVVTPADAGDILMNIKWSIWNDKTAQGDAMEMINNCEPNCAAGKSTSMQVKIALSDPKIVNGKSYSHFSKLEITPKDGKTRIVELN